MTEIDDIRATLQELQRAVGRIEGAADATLRKLDSMIINHINHENDDRRHFAAQAAKIDKSAQDQNSMREKQFAKLELSIKGLETDRDRAKGAGAVILALIGALVTFVGGAVIAALQGKIKFH